jgi:hypothetical protein
MSGRRTLLTEPLQKKICALLAEGSAIKPACIVCGVSERVYYNWQDRGRAGEEPFSRFFSAVTRARETHKANLIKRIVEAAKADWKAASWLLERQFANEFGRSEPREVVIERVIAQPPPPPEQTTKKVEWVNCDKQIPFSDSQLEFIAKLRDAAASNGDSRFRKKI